MSRRSYSCAVVVAVVTLAVVVGYRPTLASPVCDPNSGHAYEVISTGGLVWDAARSAALNTSYQACPGYLVTITSLAEWQFILGMFTANTWTGGVSYDFATFVWADGPEVNVSISQGLDPSTNCSGYCFWCLTEPNNKNGSLSYWEDAIEITWRPGEGYCGNDYIKPAVQAYMIEYGEPGCIPCPSPSASQSLSSSVSLTSTVTASNSPTSSRSPSSSHSAKASPSLTPSLTLSLTSSSTQSRSPSHTTSPSFPSSTPTTTATRKPLTPIVINDRCSKPTLFQCPSNNECKEDISDCKGTPQVAQPIEDFSFTVTNKFEDRPVRINALHATDGSFAFLFEFAPNALTPGWNVSLATGDTRRTETTNEEKDDCGERKKSKNQFLSPVVRLVVTDENGDPVKHFDVPLNITTFAHPFQASTDLSKFHYEQGDDLCFAYNEDEGKDGWKCNDEFEARATRTRDVAWTKTTSDHLTSFAVLLGSPTGSSSSCGGLDWISITSLSMIAAAIFLAFLCSVSYWWSVSFRAFVGGYDRDKKMSAIQKNVISKQGRSV